MLFETFLKQLPLIESSPLLAPDAHIKMASIERSNYFKNYDYSIHNPRKAAVLALFYPKDKQTNLLLIVRSEYLGVHSSQISFPGGKMESFDASLEETALRETFEEVGIPKEKIKILKQCSNVYIPPSNFIVSPFIGISNHELQTNIDTREVNKILEISLSDLLSDKSVSKVEVSTSYQDQVMVPAFIVSNHVIWGATAMMLNEIKEIIHTTL